MPTCPSLRHLRGFIGNDATGDSAAGARSWLARFPVSFPSYRDTGDAIARTLNPVFALDTPVTYFYSRTGVQWIHPGSYLSEHSLRAEIKKYLGV